MAFIRVSGKPNIEYYAKAASAAGVMAVGALTYFDGSGYVIPADDTSGDHIGICMKAVTAADADYASNTSIPIDVPAADDIFEVSCAATAVATLRASIGEWIDLTDSVTANPAATAKFVLKLVGYISTTRLLVKVGSRNNNLRTATS